VGKGVARLVPNSRRVFYIWILLALLGAVAALWFLLFLGWALQLRRIVKSGAIRSWDELTPETAELRPLALRRRFRFRLR
jgi:hypothetical protein